MEETLTPLDPDRRAYRLVGGVLVERTVKEVLPSVATNRENVSDCSLVDANGMSCSRLTVLSDAAGKGDCYSSRAAQWEAKGKCRIQSQVQSDRDQYGLERYILF